MLHSFIKNLFYAGSRFIMVNERCIANLEEKQSKCRRNPQRQLRNTCDIFLTFTYGYEIIIINVYIMLHSGKNVVFRYQKK